MNHNKTNIFTYNQIAKGFHQRNSNVEFWRKEFIFLKKQKPGKKVIDIGCGTGRDANLFLEAKFDYLGVDASAGMLKVAKLTASQGKFKVMDFYKLNFPQNSFDCFWATAAFLHIPKSKVVKVLKSVYKITKLGGIGFISMKKIRHLEEGQIFEDKYVKGGIKRFFAFYRKAEFAKLLKEVGFKVIKSYQKDSGDAIWLCYFVKKV